MQFCHEPGCRVLVARGRCAQHASRGYGRPAYVQAHRWYVSRAWLRLRAEVLREEPFCRTCLEQARNVLTTDIDHIIKHDGDHHRFFNRANLQGLCKACHTAKTMRGE
jgi:5-methylcytosine-specific restriction enzyme A